MAILMEKEISIDRTIAISNDESYALARPTREKIVELLNKKQLNVEQIRRRLKNLVIKNRLQQFGTILKFLRTRV